MSLAGRIQPDRPGRGPTDADHEPDELRQQPRNLRPLPATQKAAAGPTAKVARVAPVKAAVLPTARPTDHKAAIVTGGVVGSLGVGAAGGVSLGWVCAMVARGISVNAWAGFMPGIVGCAIGGVLGIYFGYKLGAAAVKKFWPAR